MKLLEYQTTDGVSPFAKWYNSLDAVAAAKITVALTRMEQGNLSNAKSVGAGVLEFRINFGAGYRVYFGRDGETIIILLAGGTKKRQQNDIENAKSHWLDYKLRKKKG
ncbi:FIG022160: hypothetical toxin [hydrothermal vent metagenome]|uniref:FIG022160: hypothetical toxin n=1 Tax=hydrothermal vent metagenome TaxID=652676 RepID=A0A3B0TBC1_9ZZZZ